MSKLSNLKGRLNINGRDIFNSFEKGYRSKAKEYIKNPIKLNSLYEKSKRKAQTSKGTLSEIWNELGLILELIRDWKDGNYREIPKNSLIMLVIALIYFLVPTDFLVDAIPFIGLVDDAAVLGFVIKQIRSDLENYQKWRSTQE